MADTKKTPNTIPITVLPPGIDQHEAARAHAQAQEQATNGVMKSQTRQMGASENTKGDAMLVGGKFSGLARVK